MVADIIVTDRKCYGCEKNLLCHDEQQQPQRSSFKKCSGCKYAEYCCKKCQKTHWKVHRNVCKEENKLLFSQSVEDFLDCKPRSSSLSIFVDVFGNIQQKGIGYEDQWVVALIASGLIPACFQTLANDETMSSRESKLISRSLLTTAIEKDICWYYITAYRNMALDSKSDQYFGIVSKSGILPDELLANSSGNTDDGVLVSCSNARTSLLGLTLLKLVLWTIRLLEKHHGGEYYPDQKLNVCLSRLIARCLYHEGTNVMDIELVSCGAFPSIWKQVTKQAAFEYYKGDGIARKLIRRKAFQQIIKPLEKQDVELCKWMLGSKSGVCVTLSGWLAGGAWRRSPEVAVEAKTWKAMRDLLYVGAQQTSTNNNSRSQEEEWNKKTFKAVSLLQSLPQEEQFGFFSKMPTILAYSNPRTPHLAESLVEQNNSHESVESLLVEHDNNSHEEFSSSCSSSFPARNLLLRHVYTVLMTMIVLIAAYHCA